MPRNKNTDINLDVPTSTERAFELAVERYAELGIDVGKALDQLRAISISIQCWQGDDVRGFEHGDASLGNGLAVTGNYLGRARTVDELRADLEQALALIPGRHRLNLHAIYGEFTEKTERNEIGVEHFQGWLEWARNQQIKLDFNPTFFAHRHSSDGFTLTHNDPAIRQFWIEHGVACRRIAAEMGHRQQSPCINNVWIPDGYKDLPADRYRPREVLAESLDRMFLQPFKPLWMLDAIESKLFGIGSESYVAASHEFCLGYAITRKITLCLDAGHFHPTEVISDKISSTLLFVPRLLLHVSRGVRWDSDHVVTLSDELQAICQEVIRGDFLQKVSFGLDYFDASINRIAAWVIGTRNVLKGILLALVEPTDKLVEYEINGDYTSRLALLENLKTLPWGAVWDYYCQTENVPLDTQWPSIVNQYERAIAPNRG